MKTICPTCWSIYKHNDCHNYPHKIAPLMESAKYYNEIVDNYDIIHKDCPMILTGPKAKENFIKAFNRLYT